MKKQSVVQTPQGKKQSSGGEETCPKCGGPVEKIGSQVRSCRSCGTEPWEPKK